MIESLIRLKQQFGVSYKKMADECGINYNTFKGYVCKGLYPCKENEVKIQKYLEKWNEKLGGMNKK